MEIQEQKLEQTQELLPAIRRGRFGTLTIYEISDAELEILEQGFGSSTTLTYATFLLSLAAGFAISLFTTKIESERTFTVFVVVIVVGCFLGLWLLLKRRKESQSVTKLVAAIRKRLPPEGEAGTTG